MKALALTCFIAGIAAVVASFFFTGEMKHFLIIGGLLFASRGDTLLILADMRGWKRL